MQKAGALYCGIHIGLGADGGRECQWLLLMASQWGCN